MTKEEALQKIEELKGYVEKCEEEEKEIPEMPSRGDYNVHIVVPDEPHYPYSSWERSFENEESNDLYCILSFELANLIYARDYLGIKNVDITESLLNVWYIWFSPTDKLYHWACFPSTLLLPHMRLNKAFTIWCFTDEKDAIRVCDYLNKYVKDIKKNIY